MLTKEQQRQREHKITASMAPVIMGDKTGDMITALWEELIGQRPPPDFSDNWPVQFGSYNESFILDWHARKTGQPLLERGRVVPHPKLRGISCTLDAYRAADDCVIDAKVCAGQKLDDLIDWYTPQIIVQMRCRGAARGSLLIVHSGREPVEHAIEPVEAYEAELWDRMLAFQRCVENFMPPVSFPPIVPPDRWRTVRLTGDQRDWPNWGKPIFDMLALWRVTEADAKSHAKATEEIKKLLPADVRRVVDGESEIKRNVRGAITIKRGGTDE